MRKTLAALQGLCISGLVFSVALFGPGFLANPAAGLVAIGGLIAITSPAALVFGFPALLVLRRYARRGLKSYALAGGVLTAAFLFAVWTIGWVKYGGTVSVDRLRDGSAVSIVLLMTTAGVGSTSVYWLISTPDQTTNGA